MDQFSRRDILKKGLIGLAAVAMPVRFGGIKTNNSYAENQKLGRVCKGKVYIRTRPYVDSTVVKEIYDDTLVEWLREVVGENPGSASSNWVETPDGYIYAPRLQPVYNRVNPLVDSLPETAIGKGFWGEVTIPYVDLQISNPPIRAKGMEIPRLYYGQVVWIDDLKTTDDGKTLYRVNERYGYGDLFWASGEAFHRITEDDVTPINPEIEDKKIQVNLLQQTLSCYEGKNEVFFCRISSGGKYDKDGNPSDSWSTPIGPHPIYRKLISLFMSGPITGNWSGVAWTSLITGEGVAVHSTYWHNEFGVPRSHGCINVSPVDAKWIFRWTYPPVSLFPGELDVSEKWPPIGTVVNVVG